MTKAEYPYPTDEFDDVDPDAGPRAAHRAPRSRWSKIWPFLLVIILFPALAYGAVTYWSMDQGGVPAASSSSGAAATTPAETPSATSPATPAETPSVPPVVVPDPPVPPDLSTPVVVFNSTNRSGLAASAAGALEDAGWESVTAGNYEGGTLETSTVIFGSADLETTAQAAADELGITTIQLAEGDSVEGIEIVLENDFDS